MTTDNHNGWYTTAFKNWPKQAGAKPSTDLLATVHGLGLRPGKQAMACSMALRPEGVTGAQIVMVCGNPQLVRMRGLVTARLMQREAVPRNELDHTVYKLTLTKKGETIIAQRKVALANAVAGKPAKAKVTKAKRPKAAKAKVTVQPEPQPAPQAEQPQAEQQQQQ